MSQWKVETRLDRINNLSVTRMSVDTETPEYQADSILNWSILEINGEEAPDVQDVKVLCTHENGDTYDSTTDSGHLYIYDSGDPSTISMYILGDIFDTPGEFTAKVYTVSNGVEDVWITHKFYILESVQAILSKDLLEEFKVTEKYVVGDIVLYVISGAYKFYRFKVDHSPGVWNPSHVDEIPSGYISDLMSNIYTRSQTDQKISEAISSLSDVYYNKEQSDDKFVQKTVKINNKPLSENIQLDATDIGYEDSNVGTTLEELSATVEKTIDDIDALKLVTGLYQDDDIVGIEINYVDKTFTRLQSAVGLTAGADFDKFPMYGGRKRCNVADNGTINAWFGDAGFAEDGSNGQVMVYQPVFYYMRVPLKVEPAETMGYHIRKEAIFLSDTPKTGFKRHAAFYDVNGDEIDYVMFSAYEASIFDVSANANLMLDEQVMNLNEDKLSSIAGAKPASGLTQQFTRPNVEKMANNRGANWHGDLITLESANQILAIVELGMMNGQTAIESGVSDITDNSAYNCSSLTGSTSALGDATGAATSTTNEINGTTTEYDTAGKRAISYRGVENPFGNIWKFVYGINIYGNGSQGGGVPYVCTDFAFAESKNSGNYESAGFALANVNGYISAMGYGNEKFDWLFMPSEINGNGANSTLPVGDYLYRTENLNGYRIVLLGGSWYSGSYCGFFCWNCSAGVGGRLRSLGGRLAYVPVAGTAHNSVVSAWETKMAA